MKLGVDDREARRVSRILRVTPVGAFGVIVQAFRQNLVARKEALKTVDDLIKAGFRVDSTPYRTTL
jgi:predicted nucleic acid-binding protein